MEYDEAHIIQDVLEGKTSRYEYFLDKYGQQVFTLIVRIVASQEDAEELTQDTFLKAFRHLSSFKAESNFSTWIYRIAYNTAISAALFAPSCPSMSEKSIPISVFIIEGISSCISLFR